MPGPLPFLLLLLTATPALAETPDLAAGERLFLDICAPCHGERADNATGGGIAGLPLRDVQRAVQGIEQMPPQTLTPEEVNAIAAWLAVLGGS
jgi:Cytochrome c, mono- and diheme variants